MSNSHLSFAIVESSFNGFKSRRTDKLAVLNRDETVRFNSLFLFLFFDLDLANVGRVLSPCTNDALTVVIAGGTAPDGNKMSFLVGAVCSLLLTALPTSDSLMNNVLALPDRATRRWRLRLLDQKSISQARSRCFATTYQAPAVGLKVRVSELLVITTAIA